MNDQASIGVFYVADGPRLETQSWLLAATLADAHRGDGRVQQFAYVGAEFRPQIRDITHALYEATGVAIRTLPPTPNWKRPYPHGNKLVAAADDRGTSHSIFLDTDIACTASLAEFLQLAPGQIAAAPEGRPTWGSENDRWARAYAFFGLPFPEARIRLLRGARAVSVPYFNAGFIAFSEAPWDADGSRFGHHWLRTALEFDWGCAIGSKRPWLDQITLPLTAARHGYDVRVLDERHNYSLSHRGDYTRTPDAVILHYHRHRFLNAAPQWPRLKALVLDAVPSRFRDEMAAHVASIQAAVEDGG